MRAGLVAASAWSRGEVVRQPNEIPLDPPFSDALHRVEPYGDCGGRPHQRLCRQDFEPGGVATRIGASGSSLWLTDDPATDTKSLAEFRDEFAPSPSLDSLRVSAELLTVNWTNSLRADACASHDRRVASLGCAK